MIVRFIKLINIYCLIHVDLFLNQTTSTESHGVNGSYCHHQNCTEASDEAFGGGILTRPVGLDVMAVQK